MRRSILRRGLVWLAPVLVPLLGSCQTAPDGNHAHADLGSDKVGVIDVQAVFERSKSGKQALDRLVADFGERRQILTTEEAQLKEMAGRLEQAGPPGESATLRIETEQYLARLEQYRANVQAFNLEVARRHRALVNDYLPKIAAVAKPIAEQRGFTTVLHQGRPETVMIIYYRAPEIDLTDLVIEALDRPQP